MYTNWVKVPRCGSAITFNLLHRRQRWEDHEFEDGASYTARPCLKEQKRPSGTMYTLCISPKCKKLLTSKSSEGMQTTQTSGKSLSCPQTPEATGVQRSARFPEVRPHPALSLPCRLQVERPGQGCGTAVWAGDAQQQCLGLEEVSSYGPAISYSALVYHYMCNAST